MVGAQGRRRALQLAAEYAAERQALTVDLLAGLGRAPTAVDRIAAENLAAMHVRAHRLEAQGRDATEERRQITQMMRAAGFKPTKAAVQPRLSPSEKFAAMDAAQRTTGARTEAGASAGTTLLAPDHSERMDADGARSARDKP
jgi:hypothetical protein